MGSGNPLDRPVRVFHERMIRGVPFSVTVRPADVLAALDDDQRRALIRDLLDPHKIDHRTMNQIAQGMNAPMMCTNGGRTYEAQRLDRAVHAVVAALCGEAPDA